MNRRAGAIAIFSVAGLWIGMGPLTAGPPPSSRDQITVQARLTRDGQPLNGLLSLVFRIHDAPSGGGVLWEEAHDGAQLPQVPVTNGILSVVLGEAVPLDSSVFDPAGADRWVGIVLGDEEVTRIKLTASAYSVSAGTALALWSVEDSQPLDLAALDGRYIRADGGGTGVPALTVQSLTLTNNVGGSGRWRAAAIEADRGGTGQTAWSRGELLYADGTNSLRRLPPGQEGQVLTMVNGVPAWADPADSAEQRVALRHFDGATGDLVVATGFRPHAVIVSGFDNWATGHVSGAVGDGANVQRQVDFAFGVGGPGSAVTEGRIMSGFAGIRRVVQMDSTRVRVSQPTGASFAGWIMVIGQE